ncbi:MAG: RNA methyltransferase [Bacteroidota bacterium]
MLRLSKAKLKLFTALSQKKYRYEQQRFVIEGVKMVEEAISSNFLVEAIIVEDTKTSLLEAKAIPSDISLFSLPLAEFRQLSKLQHPEGICAIVAFPQADFLTAKPLSHLPEGKGFLLDGLQDPGNVGTILRTLDWFGASWIVCGPGTVDILNPKCLRASMGAIFRVHIQTLTDWASLHPTEMERIYLADMQGVDLREVNFSQDACILMGNEAKGVSSFWRAQPATHKIHIPGGGEAESLNAGIAAGILAWKLWYD